MYSYMKLYWHYLNLADGRKIVKPPNKLRIQFAGIQYSNYLCLYNVQTLEKHYPEQISSQNDSHYFICTKHGSTARIITIAIYELT